MPGVGGAHHNVQELSVIADLVIRPISGPEEIGLFNTLPGPYNDILAEDLDKGLCKPE